MYSEENADSSFRKWGGSGASELGQCDRGCVGEIFLSRNGGRFGMGCEEEEEGSIGAKECERMDDETNTPQAKGTEKGKQNYNDRRSVRFFRCLR